MTNDDIQAYLRTQSRPRLDHLDVVGETPTVTFRAFHNALDGAVVLTLHGDTYEAELKPRGLASFQDISDSVKAATAFTEYFSLSEKLA